MAEAAQVLEVSNVFQLADRFRALKERKDALEEELSVVNEELTKVDQEMVQTMINEEIPRFTRNGKSYHLTTRIFASPVAEKKDEFFDWLSGNGYGGMLKLGVNANTLSSWVKEQLEDKDELPEPVKSMVNYHSKTSVGMRKAGK